MLRACLTSTARVAAAASPSTTRPVWTTGLRLARTAAVTAAVHTPACSRQFHRTSAVHSSSLPSSSSSSSSSSTPPAEEPRLSLTFTCTVQDCNHRSSHTFTRRSYERGIVLVQCPNCKNRHLIADNLSWFTETPDEPKNVEQMVAAKGGRIRKGVQYLDGKDYETVEIYADSDQDGDGEGTTG